MIVAAILKPARPVGDHVERAGRYPAVAIRAGVFSVLFYGPLDYPSLTLHFPPTENTGGYVLNACLRA
ncbi:MAG: hypothetical protein ACRDIU_07740 [Actinomycetota bacterium]